MIRFLQSGNKAAKYILAGFLLILAASMVTYLIPGFMSDSSLNSPQILAKVDGQEIRNDAVQKAITAQLQQSGYPESLRPFIAPRVMEQMIQREELRYEAHRIGLTVSDQEVRDDLENGAYKSYFFPDGKWVGQQKYEQIVTAGGGTVADFEHSVQDDLLFRKLVSTITAGVTVAPAEIEDAYKDKNNKVKFQYAVLSLADVTKGIKPTEAELKAFYDTNLARYKNSIPEKRQLRYFVLQDKDAESKVSLSPAEIGHYYTSHQEDYRTPDRVKVRHILISVPPAGPDGKPDPKAVEAARAKAADLLKQIKGGADFAELAKKNSQDPGSASKGGEMGWITKGQTVAEFEKTAFAQNPGQISDPVETSFGFHIIQTEDKEMAHVKPLAEVRDRIEATLKAQKVAAYLETKADAAENTAQKESLDKAAAQAEATVITSNLISRSDSLPGVGSDPQLMGTIFASDTKAAAQLERFPQGYIIFQVTKIEPPKTPSFDEIKEQVAGDFKSGRGTDLLQKKTQELADRAHAQHDLAKAAREAGATLKSSELVARSAQVPDLGSMSGPLSAAFSLKPGEISGPLNLGQKGVVLQVSDRQEASTSDPEFQKQRDSLREQLASRKQQEAMELFLTNLDARMKKEGKLKINNSAVGQLAKNRS
jgi:peptidyl-prolyl cis-trans isomerase D